MIKIIMHGCNGRMGQVVTNLCNADDSIEIVAGIDSINLQKNVYPVFQRIDECQIQADVIIDFASVHAMNALLAYGVERQIPMVLCTTGLNEEQLEKITEASEKVAVLRSANMSLGINLLMDLVKKAARTLAEAGFDMEIVEKHHNQKLDAPSGTALALADSINEAMNHVYSYTYDRSKELKKRDKREIGIHAVRGGSIVGEHDVIFAGPDEVITFSHTAYSKTVFAKGAVEAAKFLAGKPAGKYDMSEVAARKQ